MGNRKRWRGLKSLVHDAVDATVDLVAVGHESTARAVVGTLEQVEPLRGPVRVADGVRRVSTVGVLGTIKVVNRAVEAVSDVALDVAERYADPEEDAAAVPMRSDATGEAGWAADAAIGLVNAAVGDQLEARGNPLDLAMQLRAGDQYLPPEAPALRDGLSSSRPKLAVFVHGLGTTEWSWCLESEAYHGDPGVSFGSLLERDLDFTSLYVRYNTGRRIPQNGRRLAELLEATIDAYPDPLEELSLLGHSMGGLVVRSACHYGVEAGHRWPERVRRVFTLGSPHRGAPLARFGHALHGVLDAIDLPGTKVTARILDKRSAGIRDLQHGAIVDEDWLVPFDAMTPVPPLPDAHHYYLGATLTDDPDHPVGRLVGDLLVRTDSASGPHTDERQFTIETARFGGVLHHQLQNHPAVYAQIREACED